MNKFNNLDDYVLISHSEVEEARKAGLCLHHEVEVQWMGDERIVTRDEWYVAHPAWVAQYYANGGTWAYAD